MAGEAELRPDCGSVLESVAGISLVNLVLMFPKDLPDMQRDA